MALLRKRYLRKNTKKHSRQREVHVQRHHGGSLLNMLKDQQGHTMAGGKLVRKRPVGHNVEELVNQNSQCLLGHWKAFLGWNGGL